MTRFIGIGDRIRERLNALGYWKKGRPDVAKFCEEKRSRPQYVYAWLKDRVPGPENLNRLAQDLGVSGPWIMFGDQVGPLVAEGAVRMVAEANARSAAPVPRMRSGRESAAPAARAEPPAHPKDAGEPAPKVRIIDFKRLREVTDKLVLLEAELDAIFQAFPDLYFWLDADGTVLDCKAGFGSDFPVLPEALIGNRLADVLPANVQHPLSEAFLRALEAGTLAACEFSLAAGGEERAYEARFVPLVERPSRGKKVLTIVRDITERKRAEGGTKALVEVGKRLTEAVDLDRVLGLVVEKAAQLLHAPASAVFLVEQAEEGMLVRFVQSHGLPAALESSHYRADGEGTVGKAIQERRPVWTADVLNDPAVWVSEETRQRIVEHGIPRAILSAPLVRADVAIGGLVVYRPVGTPYRPEEGQLLAGLASQAAIAIENARLFQQEQQERRQLEAVRAVTAEITRELELSRLLGLIHRRAAELVGAVSGTVHLWDEAAQALFPKAWHNIGDWMRDMRFRLGEGIVGVVAQRRVGLIVNDYRAWSNAIPRVVERAGFTAGMGEPLLYGDRLLGVITLADRRETHVFTEEDRKTLALFAAHAAIAIENARLFQEEQERRQQVEAVRAVTEEITRELDLTRVLTLIHRRAAELVGATSGLVYFWDPAAQVLVPQTWFGSEEHVVAVACRLGEGVTGAAALRRQGVFVNDYQNWPNAHPAVLEHGGIVGVLAEPLVYRDRLLGVITLNMLKNGGRPFTEADENIMALFAAHAAIAIENARLYAEERSRARDFARLIRAAQVIASSPDLAQVLETVVQSAVELTGAAVAVIRLEEEGWLVRKAAAGPLREEVAREEESARVAVGQGLPGTVAAQGRSVWVPDLAADPRNLPQPIDARHGLRWYLGVPIFAGTRVLGVLGIRGSEVRTIPEELRNLLESLAALAALAIDRIRLSTGIRPERPGLRHED